jgi:hypothetical protein
MRRSFGTGEKFIAVTKNGRTQNDATSITRISKVRHRDEKNTHGVAQGIAKTGETISEEAGEKKTN